MITTNLTAENIEKAFERLAKATEEYFETSTEASALKAELDCMIAKQTGPGLPIDGKNDGTRAGQALELYPSEHIQVETAQKIADKAKLELDLAKIDIDQIKTCLKLAEISLRQFLADGRGSK